MAIYINGLGNISIQDSVRKTTISSPISYSQPLVSCIDPNFKDYINPLQLRRMSKIVKRAIVSALLAVEDAGIVIPDAIISGTGLGCMADTEKFLSAMIENSEKFLQPTYFIQSTHNTIGSQIAIYLKCHNYNNTYSHISLSFDMALYDAYLQFLLGDIQSALVGGYDEMTPDYFQQLNKVGYWKENVQDSLYITESETDGSFAGEGSIAFVLSNSPMNAYAELKGLKFLHAPKNNEEVKRFFNAFLKDNNLAAEDVDIFMMGKSGDSKHDKIYDEMAQMFFPQSQWAIYKNLSGEFYTASAFGFWSAVTSLKNKQILDIQKVNNSERNSFSNILLYNQFQNRNHSLILLSSCG